MTNPPEQTYPVPYPDPLPDPTPHATGTPQPFPTLKPPLVLTREHTRPARYDPDPAHEDPDGSQRQLTPEITTFEPPVTPIAIRFGPSPDAYPGQPRTEILAHNGVWYTLTPEFQDPPGYDPDGERPYSTQELMTRDDYEKKRRTIIEANGRNKVSLQHANHARKLAADPNYTPPPMPPMPPMPPDPR